MSKKNKNKETEQKLPKGSNIPIVKQLYNKSPEYNKTHDKAHVLFNGVEGKEPLAAEKIKSVYGIQKVDNKEVYFDEKGKKQPFNNGRKAQELSSDFNQQKVKFAKKYAGVFFSDKVAAAVEVKYQQIDMKLSSVLEKDLISPVPNIPYKNVTATLKVSIKALNELDKTLSKAKTYSYANSTQLQNPTPTDKDIIKAVTKALKDQDYVTGTDLSTKDGIKKLQALNPDDFKNNKDICLGFRKNADHIIDVTISAKDFIKLAQSLNPETLMQAGEIRKLDPAIEREKLPGEDPKLWKKNIDELSSKRFNETKSYSASASEELKDIVKFKNGKIQIDQSLAKKIAKQNKIKDISPIVQAKGPIKEVRSKTSEPTSSSWKSASISKESGSRSSGSSTTTSSFSSVSKQTSEQTSEKSNSSVRSSSSEKLPNIKIDQAAAKEVKQNNLTQAFEHNHAKVQWQSARPSSAPLSTPKNKNQTWVSAKPGQGK